MIIDLGCGQAKTPNAIGMDNVALPEVDVVHDLLDFPYPFDDGCADEIYFNHVIEHFSLVDIQRILKESHRILKSNGTLYIRVPHIYSVAAWADPTHRMAFTFTSGSFFDLGADKAYYKELNNRWKLISTSSRVIMFNWKRYRMRKVDTWISNLFARFFNWMLRQADFPGSADILVKILPVFFVEIEWQLCKPEQ